MSARQRQHLAGVTRMKFNQEEVLANFEPGMTGLSSKALSCTQG